MSLTKLSLPVLIGSLSVAGCANNVSKTMTAAIAGAPEWFEERRDEMAGDDYPKLNSVPSEQAEFVGRAQIETEQEELIGEAQEIESDPRSFERTEKERKEALAWAKSIRDGFPPDE